MNRQPSLKIEGSPLEKSVSVKIWDNGLGIDLEKHGDRMFKPFEVVHRTKDSNGFGLYTVDNQIRQLNGSIAVRSQPDEFTEFEILLPQIA